jgi:lipoprotein-releasing system permease protein
LGLIILVAAVNIFFSLSMLVIEKRDDIRMLFAMGATASTVKRIFLFEGSLVALTGAIVGLVLGVVICWLQQTYGLVSMGMVSSLVDAYPVKMEWPDFVITALTVIAVTITVSYLPAKRAAEMG